MLEYVTSFIKQRVCQELYGRKKLEKNFLRNNFTVCARLVYPKMWYNEMSLTKCMMKCLLNNFNYI